MPVNEKKGWTNQGVLELFFSANPFTPEARNFNQKFRTLKQRTSINLELGFFFNYNSQDSLVSMVPKIILEHVIVKKHISKLNTRRGSVIGSPSWWHLRKKMRQASGSPAVDIYLFTKNIFCMLFKGEPSQGSSQSKDGEI